MNIVYEWLKELVDAPPPEETARLLTMTGLEVEAVRNPYAGLDAVVSKIVSMRPHPSADKLRLCDIDTGSGKVSVVCGATNVFEGALVPWLRPGSKTASGREVGEVAIRGEKSAGMLASMEDLGLEEKSEGIWILPGKAPIGRTIEEALGKNAEVLEVNVTPNRGDALSHIGVAREVAAASGAALKIPDFPVDEDAEPASSRIGIEVRDFTACPRYLSRVICGVKIGPSPEWMARRLSAAGVRPINNVVDATNYVMIELGHPMHAFDLSRVRGAKIVVRRAERDERIVTIDGVERRLETSDLVIADGEGPVAVAGVMGGEGSGISGSTADILLECACFEPLTIRRTSSRLMLASESSYRFERGVDPGGLERALDRCAALISATAGGKVLAGRPGSGAVPDKIAVSLRPARLDAVAGTHIEFTEARRILSSLGFEAGGEGTDFTEFLVPTHRPDAALEEDLIEEVIRLYGYDRIPPSIPSSAGFAESAREMPDLLRTARDVMSGAGFYEAVNYSFIDGGLALSLGFAAVPVKVRNPISEDMAVMRTSLIPGLLSNARHNLRRQQRSVRLFEAGRVFVSSESGGLPIERVNVAAVLCGKRGERTWAVTDADFDFFDMKGLVERLAGGLGVPEIEFSSAGLQPCLHPGRGAVVISGGAEAGFLGQLHPGMASSMDIPAKLFLFEIDLAVFTAPRRSDAVYAPYTDFPSVERDIAIVVGMGVSAGELVAAVKGLGIPEVASVSVFDIYTGAQIGGGMKNVALSITCRAPDRTLRDSEVEDMHARITAALSQKFGGALRA